jgi:hypothetical protein
MPDSPAALQEALEETRREEQRQLEEQQRERDKQLAEAFSVIRTRAYSPPNIAESTCPAL